MQHFKVETFFLFLFLVYVEQGRSTTATTLTFTTASTSGITWKAKISQIECSSLSRGDPDCNQYITGKSGTVNVGLMSHSKCFNRRRISKLLLNIECLFRFCFLDRTNSIKTDLHICNWPVCKTVI